MQDRGPELLFFRGDFISLPRVHPKTEHLSCNMLVLTGVFFSGLSFRRGVSNTRVPVEWRNLSAQLPVSIRRKAFVRPNTQAKCWLETLMLPRSQVWSPASSLNSILEALRNADVQAHEDVQNSSLPLNKNPGHSCAQESWGDSALNGCVIEFSFFHPLPHSKCKVSTWVVGWWCGGRGCVVLNFSFVGHENFILFLGNSSMHLKNIFVKASEYIWKELLHHCSLQQSLCLS